MELKFDQILNEFCSKCNHSGNYIRDGKIIYWCKTYCPDEPNLKCKQCRKCVYLEECLEEHKTWKTDN